MKISAHFSLNGIKKGLVMEDDIENHHKIYRFIYMYIIPLYNVI